MAKDKKEKKSRRKVKKEKKSRKRKREDHSASDSSGEDSDPEVRTALAAMRRSELEEKLRKKAEKRRQQKLLSKFGYTNDINPFGDPNLNARFVWRKKDGAAGPGGAAGAGSSGRLRSLKQADEEDEKLLSEIDSVRRRRKEREEELAEMERLREEESRLREAATHADWADKEEAFHLEANQTRTKIRLLENRAQPIDVLARNVLLFGGEKKTVGINYQGDSEALDISSLGAELKAPGDVFQGLSLDALQRLRDQIDDYLRLEGEEGEFKDFWLSLGVVCEHHVARQQRLQEAGRNPHAAFEEAETLEDQVEQELEACSDNELHELGEEVRKEAANGGDEYWDLVTQQLLVEQAKRRLHHMHVKMLTQQLEKREETQTGAKTAARPREDTSVFFRNVKTAEEEMVLDEGLDNSMAAIALQRAEEAKEMAENEERMKLDEAAEPTHQAMAVPIAGAAPATYDWADKYRPRKPRFFNRVRTGYDWNMYNRSHYDYDNPPPKTVQGYKFNIFCPDKIDTTQTPGYTVEAADDANFAIIVFDMGAPYEKIAFTILNREWAIGRKKGFRCSYERGVFQLHFNFKRARYRR